MFTYLRTISQNFDTDGAQINMDDIPGRHLALHVIPSETDNLEMCGVVAESDDWIEITQAMRFQIELPPEPILPDKSDYLPSFRAIASTTDVYFILETQGSLS